MASRFNPNRKYISRLSHLRVGFSWGGSLTRIIPENLFKDFYIPTPETPQLFTDAYWMLQALEESSRGVGITNPNPSVGCIIVAADGKTELGRGCTQAHGGLHAETVAILEAKAKKGVSALKNATLYVTLEPCAHHGHQPPCVEALINTPIRRIVIAAQDPNPLVNGKGIRKLRKSGKEVLVGIYQQEAIASNYPFFVRAHHLKTNGTDLKRPVFGLKWAQTLDGQLADDWDHSKWISSEPSRSYTHWLRQKYDAVLVGARTVITDLPKLDARSCNLPHQHDPVPLIFDPKGLMLDCPKAAQKVLFRGLFRPNREVVIFTSSSLLGRAERSWTSKSKSVRWAALPSKARELGPKQICVFFKDPNLSAALSKPLQSVLIEGGARTLSTWLKAQCVDVAHVFIAPVVTGGIKNRIYNPSPLSHAPRFEIIHQTQLGRDVLIEMVPPHLAKSFFLK
ncbi:MAG: bifunctional diaminohydroxyphosphoribosylaminopyrimidine deaminase/5-amino-6-(5-phosphoribosylamino)uracil reductase RibD [Bdellovibrio sp.]|nr:bifunctional diaminohydroxyphosphoribosylaminopyrimidine deaminase/5-amino-6-(5-phosphoribosylamino)uracil reductase RibD [Bdellovibrio sp.]